ncbi:MAG: radical SAM protein [Polyangiaceae bacterium]
MVALPLVLGTDAPAPAGVDTRPALQGLRPEDLVEIASGITLGEARKLIALIHRGEPFPPRSPAQVRRVSFDRVRERTQVPEMRLVSRIASAIDPFVKYALQAPDGSIVETVKIPLAEPGRVSVCVSSQVGCALACSFCATGRLGLTRNLAPWEIVEQVRTVRRDLPAGVRIHGVVFQGMGEPLANFAAVKQAAQLFSEPSAQAVDARNITVSTAGLPAGIRALAASLPNLRLAVSIGSARPEVRRELIPLESRYPLATVLEAAGEHARTTDLAPLFAYTLLAGKNDTNEDAVALAHIIKDFAARFGRRPRLSLIPYNSIGEGDPFVRVEEAEYVRFCDVLVENGVIPTRRYSGGGDVAAACGQLVGNVTKIAEEGTTPVAR